MVFWLYVYVYVCLYMYVYFFFGEGYEYWDLGSVTAKFFPCTTDTWPSGTYGLPRSKTGCPQSPRASEWQIGWRLQDTEDTYANSRHSNSFHIDAVVLESHVNRSFCIKHGDKESTEAKPWPKGNDFLGIFNFFNFLSFRSWTRHFHINTTPFSLFRYFLQFKAIWDFPMFPLRYVSDWSW